SPKELSPQAMTAPPSATARLWAPPAEIAVAPPRGVPVGWRTSTGVLRSVLVPSPNCPKMLSPQATTVPSFLSARLCWTPAETAITVPAVRPLTGTGVVRRVWVPSPNWPKLLSPQATTEPSAFNARLWAPPAATAATPVRPVTRTGVERPTSVPFPNWPLALSPQAQTVPSDLTPRLWELPPAIPVATVSP